jgi:hypothetical protein
MIMKQTFPNSSQQLQPLRLFSNTKYTLPSNYMAGHGSREVACFLFARSEAVTVGSNPTQGMDV